MTTWQVDDVLDAAVHTYGVIREPEDLLCRPQADIKPEELVLGFARHWILARGGRLEVHVAGGVQNILRSDYPLAAA